MNNSPVLEIQALRASVEDNQILKGLDLTLPAGEIHAVMGPNGSGKSTLAKVLAGHPAYRVDSGTVIYKGENLLALASDERARRGVFMAFQYPQEVPGVSILNFLRTALNMRVEKELSVLEFRKLLYAQMDMLEMDHAFAARFVNEGFSGGEKKRNEILQMAMLKPELAILDETDSGLDIDALRIVAEGVNKVIAASTPAPAVLLITHYNRILDYIKPHFVHVLSKGKIVRSGSADLALELEEKGYDWLVPEESGAAG